MGRSSADCCCCWKKSDFKLTIMTIDTLCICADDYKCQHIMKIQYSYNRIHVFCYAKMASFERWVNIYTLILVLSIGIYPVKRLNGDCSQANPKQQRSIRILINHFWHIYEQHPVNSWTIDFNATKCEMEEWTSKNEKHFN